MYLYRSSLLNFSLPFQDNSCAVWEMKVLQYACAHPLQKWIWIYERGWGVIDGTVRGLWTKVALRQNPTSNQHVFGGRLLSCFDLAGTLLIGRCGVSCGVMITTALRSGGCTESDSRAGSRNNHEDWMGRRLAPTGRVRASLVETMVDLRSSYSLSSLPITTVTSR